MVHQRRILGFILGVGLALAVQPFQVSAQGTGLNFSGLQNVRGLPVEITSENLQVNNQTGETIFTGDAVLGQGDMRLSAPEIRIIYDAAGDNSIERLEAYGGVTLVTADEAAEGQTAIYEVAAGTVRMQGSVLLTQGPNILTGDTLFVDLNTEQGRMEGNVRTLIQTNP
ncbi:MAG: LptA/OstA family protein [Rhodobacteraceae bacterium]|nr:LptA/OstA family protein [Paracoccaceae bacterium]